MKADFTLDLCDITHVNQISTNSRPINIGENKLPCVELLYWCVFVMVMDMDISGDQMLRKAYPCCIILLIYINVCVCACVCVCLYFTYNRRNCCHNEIFFF